MIELKHVSKTYDSGANGGVDALKDVSLTIEDGDIYGIIGMSGAGKSTLVRCINLLERPTKGEIIVDGQRLDTMTPAQLRAARRNITMIFQHFNLLMQRTCLRNVCFPMEISGVKRADAEKRGRELLELELDIGGGTDDALWREYNLIYQCVTLPAQTLAVSYPLFDGDGTPTRPSFLVTRIGQLFGALPRPANPDAQRLLAPAPALELAGRTLRGAADPASVAARAWFRQHDPAALAALTRAAHTARGRLSPERVRALYGRRLYFSACRYAYFLQYGLRAKPRRPAAFNPPEIGTFFHYVLQHTAQDVTEAGGFAAVTDEQLGRFTDRWTQRYIHDELNDFQEKSARFTYLFRRLCQQVRQVVADMAHELRAGDFVPLDFELNFADPEQIAPITLSDGEVTLNMSGVADRVDGWLHDGKLYLRVVDYKTGRKAFSLSDVWYGMGLQMLLYLFALERSGPERYGHEIVPAGVLYVPARDVLIPADRRLSPEEAAKERAGAVRRSGLLLDDAAVLHAMEHSDTPQYLPLSSRRKADALASAEQLGLLARHIETTLLELAHELRDGSITADPYFRSGQDTACTHCDYLSVCHFTPGVEGDCHRVLTKLPADKIWSSLKGGEMHG